MAVEVSAQQVKALRDATGAGFNDCRTALAENDGDMAKATDYLRKKGMATAAKKADRTAKEGVIQGYMHHNGRLGVMVEVNCETDFVARNEQFKKFAKDLALHIANMAPRYLSRSDVPQTEVDYERSVQREKTLNEGKKEAVVDKIVDGRMEKWYEEIVLMEQPWLHGDEHKVSEVLTQLIAEIKENIVIRRFSRFALGESNGDESAGDH
ncbi:MAG TPA: translation elongation factor Ts [Aggregatilineales bacterium]|nr:translation elongation factor Ts [Aggregatilineales bacterium]